MMEVNKWPHAFMPKAQQKKRRIREHNEAYLANKPVFVRHPRDIDISPHRLSTEIDAVNAFGEVLQKLGNK